MASLDVLDLSYFTVNFFVLRFHSAVSAPASVAAFSIFFSHMPQFPDTLMVSVVVCAVALVANDMPIITQMAIIICFILVDFSSLICNVIVGFACPESFSGQGHQLSFND
jgi:hypothetical protein